MEKLSSSLFGALVSISLLVPHLAHAYLSPDQVFGGSSGAHGAAGENLQPPPTQREGEDVVAEQQMHAAAQREEAQQELIPVDAPPVDTYVPPENNESKGLFDQNAQYELRQERIEEEKANAPTIIIGGDTEVRDSNGNVLHSGAPRVSATGPAGVLAGVAMLLAAACTFAYSHYRSRHLAIPV